MYIHNYYTIPPDLGRRSTTTTNNHKTTNNTTTATATATSTATATATNDKMIIITHNSNNHRQPARSGPRQAIFPDCPPESLHIY